MTQPEKPEKPNLDETMSFVKEMHAIAEGTMGTGSVVPIIDEVFRLRARVAELETEILSMLEEHIKYRWLGHNYQRLKKLLPNVVLDDSGFTHRNNGFGKALCGQIGVDPKKLEFGNKVTCKKCKKTDKKGSDKVDCAHTNTRHDACSDDRYCHDCECIIEVAGKVVEPIPLAVYQAEAAKRMPSDMDRVISELDLEKGSDIGVVLMTINDLREAAKKYSNKQKGTEARAKKTENRRLELRRKNREISKLQETIRDLRCGLRMALRYTVSPAESQVIAAKTLGYKSIAKKLEEQASQVALDKNLSE